MAGNYQIPPKRLILEWKRALDDGRHLIRYADLDHGGVNVEMECGNLNHPQVLQTRLPHSEVPLKHLLLSFASCCTHYLQELGLGRGGGVLNL